MNKLVIKELGKWMGQTVVFPGTVEHFGKNYIWLEDHDGTAYMLKLSDDHVPQFF